MQIKFSFELAILIHPCLSCRQLWHHYDPVATIHRVRSSDPYHSLHTSLQFWPSGALLIELNDTGELPKQPNGQPLCSIENPTTTASDHSGDHGHCVPENRKSSADQSIFAIFTIKSSKCNLFVLINNLVKRQHWTNIVLYKRGPKRDPLV